MQALSRNVGWAGGGGGGVVVPRRATGNGVRGLMTHTAARLCSVALVATQQRTISYIYTCVCKAARDNH